MSYCSYECIFCQLKVWWHFSLSFLRWFLGHFNKSGFVWMYALIFRVLLDYPFNKFTFDKWLVFCFYFDVFFLILNVLIQFFDHFFPSTLALCSNKKRLLSAYVLLNSFCLYFKFLSIFFMSSIVVICEVRLRYSWWDFLKTMRFDAEADFLFLFLGFIIIGQVIYFFPCKLY